MSEAVENDFLCLLQSSGFFVYVVPESSEINQIHYMAQLQVEDIKNADNNRRSNNYTAILLLCTRLHGQKDDRCLNFLHKYKVFCYL